MKTSGFEFWPPFSLRFWQILTELGLRGSNSYEFWHNLNYYRSHQCYESKDLHNTVVAWFSGVHRAPFLLNRLFWYRILKNVVVLFITRLLVILSRNWSIIDSRICLKRSLANPVLSHFAKKMTKKTNLREIQMLIVE